MDSTIFADAIVNNGGFIFTIIFIAAIFILSAKSGVRNGIALYIIGLIISVIGVLIGAISATILIYMITPLILIIIFKVVFKGGDE